MHLPSRLLGEYSDLRAHKVHLNYGNDGCDGFAPNFPLILVFGTKPRNIFNFYKLCIYSTTLFNFCQAVLLQIPVQDRYY